MKSEKKKILSGKECEVMNYLPYFKEPPIDVIKRYKTIKRYALICHDKDYNEKGILESPHYHIYLDFGRATVSSIVPILYASPPMVVVLVCLSSLTNKATTAAISRSPTIKVIIHFTISLFLC